MRRSLGTGPSLVVLRTEEHETVCITVCTYARLSLRTRAPRIRVCTDEETHETQQLGEDEVGDVLLAFATMPEGCVREQNCLSNTCSHLLPILRWYEGCSMTDVF